MKPSEFIDLISTSAIQIDEDISLLKSPAVKAIEDKELANFVKTELEQYSLEELEIILKAVAQRIQFTKKGFKEKGGELDQEGKWFEPTGDEYLDEMISRLDFVELSQLETALNAFIRIKNLLGNI